jgi:hypothetical protein
MKYVIGVGHISHGSLVLKWAERLGSGAFAYGFTQISVSLAMCNSRLKGYCFLQGLIDWE